MRIRQLFLLLSAALVLFPALTIGVWTYRQSVASQFEDVKERHLLMAKNMGDTLERYALDTSLIFDGIVEILSNGVSNQTSKQILKKLDFADIAIVDYHSGMILYCLTSDKTLEADRTPSPSPVNPLVLRTARMWGVEGNTVFSPVISIGSKGNFVLLLRKFGNRIAIGKLKTDYFRSLGESVSFGEKGHAVIVDNLGNVLSHPRKQWVESHKNLAKIGPVAKMLNRETGIQTFHSPLLNSELIAAYTHVASTGWGIMVPQPVSELYAASISTWKSYLVTVSISFLLAMTLVAWVSRRSTRPLLKLIAANRLFGNPGGQKILAPPKNWGVPTEIRQLYQTHNEMVTKLQNDHSDTLRMAYSDIVTGLPSREAFNQIVEYEFAKSDIKTDSYLLVFLDLDDFKLVNDTMGHETGDQVLAKVSQQIANTIGVQTGLDVIFGPLDDEGNPIRELNGSAILARIGGDEFVALIPWVRSDERINAFLRAFSYSISTPFMIGARELITSASIGAALYGRDGINIRELTKKADIAMYHAKKSGKGNFCLYDKEIGEQTPAEMQQEVAQAIQNDEMVLYYQPKISLSNGKAMSVEAVIRWIHPQKGMIPPNQFIPVINNTMIADLLGEWVIRQACKQIEIWQKTDNNISVSINIANHHLVSQNFMPNLLRIVDEIGVSPEFLEIEMTEETAMTAHKRAKHVIRALKESGFTVSLDDYGKGHSNLARLADLEIDVIKLDQSLINGITEDPRKAIIVGSALDMARNLNCKTVAEGIETREQADFISRMGCDYLQGFLFAKPMPVAELEGWLIEHNQNATISQADELSDEPMRAAS